MQTSFGKPVMLLVYFSYHNQSIKLTTASDSLIIHSQPECSFGVICSVRVCVLKGYGGIVRVFV